MSTAEQVTALAAMLVAAGCLAVGCWRMRHGKPFRPFDGPGDDS